MTIKKYRVMQDLTMNILLGDFDTLKEARAFFRSFGFEPWAEAWIMKDDGTVVQRKSVAGEKRMTAIEHDHRCMVMTNAELAERGVLK